MYKDFQRKLLGLTRIPFTGMLWLFAVVFLIISTPDIVFMLLHKMYNCIVFNIAWNYLISYAVVLIVGLLRPRWLKITVLCTVIVVLSTMSVIDFTSVFTHKTLFNSRIASSIIFTNPKEIHEFWQWGISLSTVAIIILFILLLVPLGFLLHKSHVGEKWYKWILTPALGASLLVCVARPMTYDQSYIAKAIVWYNNIKNIPPNLEKFTYAPPLMTVDNTFQNDDDFKLVFIIGESLCASHIPFYGYDKNTMPLLSNRIESGEMIYFREVVAPATNTAQAFPLIMTDMTNYGDASKWWEHLKITDIFKTAGYSMNWISNQSKAAAIDGAQVGFSKLCDNSVFILDNQNLDMTNQLSETLGYDEDIFPYLKKLHKNDNRRSLYIINLFGCHHPFNKRFPKEKTFFTTEDYTDRQESQRQTLADYDNAVRYNDFIVDSIIKEFSNDDALIVYFPDHGLDIYETWPDYAYNGIENHPESVRAATNIPLMIFMSEKYKDNHPETSAIISNSNVKGFLTTDAIYLLMDVSGLRFADNDKVAEHSPLNRNRIKTKVEQ